MRHEKLPPHGAVTSRFAPGTLLSCRFLSVSGLAKKSTIARKMRHEKLPPYGAVTSRFGPGTLISCSFLSVYGLVEGWADLGIKPAARNRAAPLTTVM